MNKSHMRSILLPVLVIGAGLLLAWYMAASKPQPLRGQPLPYSPVVMTEAARAGEAAILLRALGTVKAVQEVQVRPRVTGTVMAMHDRLQPGAHVREGEVLIQLDPTDYELELRRKESDLARARADLALEMGQQKVAKAELAQLNKALPGAMAGGNQNTALALREPHLAQARASVAAAQANVDIARVNLERATIKAPFNALVTARSVSLGSQAGTSDTLATLVDTDAYWVEATVPLDRLQAAGLIGREGVPATVRTSSGQELAGKVQRTTGVLDAASRMGQVLITVADPLGLEATPGTPPLLLGDQVQVLIDLGTRPGVVVLPRAALRGGDTVWVVKDDKLDIRPVSILWRDTDQVSVSAGLEPGELIIMSDLSAPIQGMNVRQPAAPRAMPQQGDATPVEEGQS